MPGKSTPLTDQKNASKKTEEDKEIMAYANLEKGTQRDDAGKSDTDVIKRVIVGDEPPIFDLIEDDPQAPGDHTSFACSFTNGKLGFADLRNMEKYGLAGSYKEAIKRQNGVILLQENTDDVLSSDDDDRQITYLPTGDVALMVSNTTNGADQYQVNFECDLNKNILITTSDGVKYCMPFDVVMAPRPGGMASLLTKEEQVLAGLIAAPPAKQPAKETPPQARKTPPREDPVMRDKIESGTIKEAEKVSSDDPRIMTAGGGRDQKFSESIGSTKGGTKTSVTPDSSTKTVSRGDPVGSKATGLAAGAKTGITSTYSGGSSSSSSGTKSSSSGTKTSSKSPAMASKKEAPAEVALSFKPMVFTIGGF